MVDPPLGQNAYTLKPKKLTVQHGPRAFALDLAALGSFPSP